MLFQVSVGMVEVIGEIAEGDDVDQTILLNPVRVLNNYATGQTSLVAMPTDCFQYNQYTYNFLMRLTDEGLIRGYREFLQSQRAKKSGLVLPPQ